MANLDDIARAVKLNQEACKKADEERLKLLEIAQENKDDLKKEGLSLGVFPLWQANYIYAFYGKKPRTRCFFDKGRLKPVSPVMYSSGEGHTLIYECSENSTHKYCLPPGPHELKKIEKRQRQMVFAE